MFEGNDGCWIVLDGGRFGGEDDTGEFWRERSESESPWMEGRWERREVSRLTDVMVLRNPRSFLKEKQVS